mmetsp:Transcript_8963/g.25763  ORF Transcript_8963/g.25763 Transcript_8963/m.25763 type:complete len:223 (-) Transcript_8963:761-1429(-)
MSPPMSMYTFVSLRRSRSTTCRIVGPKHGDMHATPPNKSGYRSARCNDACPPRLDPIVYVCSRDVSVANLASISGLRNDPTKWTCDVANGSIMSPYSKCRRRTMLLVNRNCVKGLSESSSASAGGDGISTHIGSLWLLILLSLAVSLLLVSLLVVPQLSPSRPRCRYKLYSFIRVNAPAILHDCPVQLSTSTMALSPSCTYKTGCLEGSSWLILSLSALSFW